MSEALQAFVGIAIAIVGLAIVAVIVSRNSQSSSVISSIGTAFGGAISAATAPIGSGVQGNPGLFSAAVH